MHTLLCLLYRSMQELFSGMNIEDMQHGDGDGTVAYLKEKFKTASPQDKIGSIMFDEIHVRENVTYEGGIFKLNPFHMGDCYLTQSKFQ